MERGKTSYRDIWRDVRVPALPAEGLIAEVATFARGVELATDGLVVSWLLGLLGAAGAPAVFQMIVGRPGTATRASTF
ncbi:hypothetical protein ACMHYB_56765 [Sorangium sp. So ce1128]